ncbi:MAG: TRAP transporter substrate-binding protein DctP [Thermodesulfobacteriota bacterium]|nr:TRAP transporter substrate-binding protein DctP [Thermodesulfobacteriota bacterium]
MMVSVKRIAGKSVFCVLIVLVVLTVFPVCAMAANLGGEQLQATVDESMRAMWTGADFRKTLDRKFEERGYALAALIDTGFFYIYSKHKVTSFDDLKNRKVMTWIGTVGENTWEALGIRPIPVAVPEVIASLSTGYGDTAVGPAAWLLGMQGYQYVEYIVNPPLLYAPAAIFVSTNTKNRLAKIFGISETVAYNCQELVIQQFNTLEPQWKSDLRKYNQKSMEAFETKCGIKFVDFSKADQSRFEAAAKHVRDGLAGKVYSREFLDEVTAALEEYRQQKNAITVGGI